MAKESIDSPIWATEADARAMGDALRTAFIKFNLEATYTYGGKATSVATVSTRFLKHAVAELSAQIFSQTSRDVLKAAAMRRVSRREFDKLKAEFVGKSIVDATEKRDGR